MNTPQVPPFLKTERQNTDESLVHERDKTNQSLKKIEVDWDLVFTFLKC